METKRRRKLELKERKNYLPTLIACFSLWLSAVAFVFFVDPQAHWAIPMFLLLIFASVLFSTAILLGNTRRGVLIALTATILLGLRIVNMATPLNVVLLIGAILAFEFYYCRK